MEENQNSGLPIGAQLAIALIVLTGLGVGGYFMFDYFKPAKTPDAPSKGSKPGVEPDNTSKATQKSSPAPTASSSAAQAPSATVLQSGSSGADVTALQTKLNAKGAGLTVDGQFGPKTLAALQKYYGQPSITTAQLAGWNNEFGGDYNIVTHVKKLPGEKFGGVTIY